MARLRASALATALAAASLATSPVYADLQPLDSEELDGIAAQDGISFEYDIRINSDAAGNIDTTICPAGNRVQCRFAIKYAAREPPYRTQEVWAVYKGFSGRIWFSRFNMDAFTSPAAGTPYASVGAGGRFIDGSGSPVSPYGKPNIKISFPEIIRFYEYKVAGLSLEFGSGTQTGLTAGLPSGNGFMADPTDSRNALGAVIDNSIAGRPATLRIDGEFRVFAF